MDQWDTATYSYTGIIKTKLPLLHSNYLQNSFQLGNAYSFLLRVITTSQFPYPSIYISATCLPQHSWTRPRSTKTYMLQHCPASLAYFKGFTQLTELKRESFLDVHSLHVLLVTSSQKQRCKQIAFKETDVILQHSLTQLRAQLPPSPAHPPSLLMAEITTFRCTCFISGGTADILNSPKLLLLCCTAWLLLQSAPGQHSWENFPSCN